MTLEEKISRLKDILAEINEDENAVCYLTSEDNESIESAIKALEQQGKIAQIIDDCYLEAWEVLEMIKEVVRA